MLCHVNMSKGDPLKLMSHQHQLGHAQKHNRCAKLRNVSSGSRLSGVGFRVRSSGFQVWGNARAGTVGTRAARTRVAERGCAAMAAMRAEAERRQLRESSIAVSI